MPKLQKGSTLRPIRPQEAGFTMIELIMVIVILGILAAVALPRFYDLQTDARMAKMQAAVGAIKSASAIAHSGALVSNQTGATGSITMEGVPVPLRNGYPDVKAVAATSGIAIAAGDLKDYTLSATATVLTVTPDPSHATCAITYTESTVAGTAPAILSTALTTANCD